MNGMPTAAVSSGDFMNGLSMLPGQRLSRCTCSGEDHPGPKHPDGTFSGRGSQVIDIFQSMVCNIFADLRQVNRR
jgi:beta-glucan synthesis-associated protein KRE6